ncbi:hypothetical protein M2475_001024 [Breznakia sp. PF5-3]|uniref:DUF4234 domain-containing protein n=1 Tax=unclassified Breznakia TaxID=2623764 RepID=UPI0024072BF1|nr:MULTISPECIES: DUF4234 domain-containing protein [unclassified Breznakia]MDF9824568.1 hypothetical protein [Breznakia sp. PM6-1]MDF9835458.1 hypothetical protein [Breznakia sp. PF5-3]MDF9837868.1 hypothetical protein [Breznakia sp. PFB2-8]MDF9859839.1 hypothetical protein [Breznakia sp. PH5-24]
MIQKKSIVTSVILGIVTCGIYNLYWMSQITNNVADIKRDNSYRTGSSVVLLTIVTCGIYGYYWVYVTSRDIFYLEQDYNMRTSDNSVINVIFAIFTMQLVPLAIMQSSINNLSDEIYSA